MALLAAHFSVWLIDLVSDEDARDVGARVLVYLLKPVGDVVKRRLTGAVVNEQDALRALVVGLGDGSKSFLTCGVPHLKFDLLTINVEILDLKIDSYIQSAE